MFHFERDQQMHPNLLFDHISPREVFPHELLQCFYVFISSVKEEIFRWWKRLKILIFKPCSLLKKF